LCEKRTFAFPYVVLPYGVPLDSAQNSEVQSAVPPFSDQLFKAQTHGVQVFQRSENNSIWELNCSDMAACGRCCKQMYTLYAAYLSVFCSRSIAQLTEHILQTCPLLIYVPDCS
jgi:hypothetical protein